MVYNNCFRARYLPSRTAKYTPFYTCFNKTTCRSLAGRQYPVLRDRQIVEPGVYEGIYDQSEKLLSANSGTCTTPATVERLAPES